MVRSIESISHLDIKSGRYFVSLTDFCAAGLRALIVTVWNSVWK